VVPRDDIAADLASGDAERIRIGIAALRELTRTGDEREVPAVEPWVLRPFGESPPADLVIDLARVLARFRSFAPRPGRAHVIRQLVELAVRYAVPQVIYETAVEIQGDGDPAAAARGAVDYLRARGLPTPREKAAADTLTGYLLRARTPVREATAGALAAEAALPAMRFHDVAVNRDERYSLGIEQHSGRYYVSIAASNGMLDYEEYYEIDGDLFEQYRADLDSALPFVLRCRNHHEDPRLMYQPSTHRGASTC
jgi:hypothetical protein